MRLFFLHQHRSEEEARSAAAVAAPAAPAALRNDTAVGLPPSGSVSAGVGGGSALGALSASASSGGRSPLVGSAGGAGGLLAPSPPPPVALGGGGGGGGGDSDASAAAAAASAAMRGGLFGTGSFGAADARTPFGLGAAGGSGSGGFGSSPFGPGAASPAPTAACALPFSLGPECGGAPHSGPQAQHAQHAPPPAPPLPGDDEGPVILHVSGLVEGVTREQLRELFSRAGEVTKVDIPDGGRSMVRLLLCLFCELVVIWAGLSPCLRRRQSWGEGEPLS